MNYYIEYKFYKKMYKQKAGVENTQEFTYPIKGPTGTFGQIWLSDANKKLMACLPVYQ